MTVIEMRARLSAIRAEESQLSEERHRLTLAIEEVEGRPDSREARFARAFLAGDSRAMRAVCVEGSVDHFREHGRWPWQDERERAAELLRSSATTSTQTEVT